MGDDRLLHASWRRDLHNCGPLFPAGGVSVQRQPLWLGRNRHTFYELHWLDSGTLEVDLDDGRRLAARGGDLMLTRPHREHRGVGDIIPPSCLLWLQVDPLASGPGQPLTVAERKELDVCLQQAGDGVWPAAELRPHYRRLRQHLRQSADAAVLRAELTLFVWAACAVLRQPHGRALSLATAKALAWLREHPTAPLRISELALHCGLSPSRFHAVFLADTGETPAACQRRLRMLLASDLLRQDLERSIGSIGEAVGFSDQRAFATAFRRCWGMSPSSWRQQRPASGKAIDAPVIHPGPGTRDEHSQPSNPA